MQIIRRMMIAAVAVAMTLAATPAFAQGAQVNTGFGIGALAGVSWTKARPENDFADFGITNDQGTGFLVGIWFGGNRDGRVGLMGELSYATKKIKLSDDFGETFEVRRKYVEIPVLLRINAGARERDKPSVYFLVGPVFDIQFDTKEFENDIEEPDSPDDFYQGLEIGLMFGAGFEVARVGIEGRYSWGLRSVLGTDAAEESGFGKTKLNTFSVVAKIRFN